MSLGAWLWISTPHARYWRTPHVFDPDRFLPEREAELTSGAYIPFGLGPRVCAGAAFAQTEACLLYTSDAVDDLTRVGLHGGGPLKMESRHRPRRTAHTQLCRDAISCLQNPDFATYIN